MAVNTFNFTTGPATLPDVGVLSYNGCVFSPLFETNVSGNVVKDAAHRTTRYVEHTITADGYVTLPANANTISPTMLTLHNLLTAHAGTLVYQGRGLDINIGPDKAIESRDVAWGPVPELLEFQPLGAGRSAKVKWQVKVRIPWIKALKVKPRGFGGGPVVQIPLVQFNFETSVSYGEDGYSTLSVKGVLEIPMTRTPLQTTRTLTATVDDYRNLIEDRVMSGIDLARFRITKRDFPISRDKRTIEWDVQAEEKPYMDLPPNCSLAHGSYTVRPRTSGMGLCNWMCTLRATYTIRGPVRQGDTTAARRNAWFAFLTLLRLRMAMSQNANIVGLDQNGNQNPAIGALANALGAAGAAIGGVGFALWQNLLRGQNRDILAGRRAWLMDFSFEEGLYLDSKTVSFSATWRLTTTFSHIIVASGLWQKLTENDGQGNNLWATSIRNVSGAQSWLPNRLDPSLDIIVDFGGN